MCTMLVGVYNILNEYTIQLVSGDEGNRKFIVTRDPTIARGTAESNSRCRE